MQNTFPVSRAPSFTLMAKLNYMGTFLAAYIFCVYSLHKLLPVLLTSPHSHNYHASTLTANCNSSELPPSSIPTMRLSVATVSLFFLGPASATDIAWYKTAGNCGGLAYYTTYNAGNAVCYHWADRPGDVTMSSVKFNNLPSGAKGQAYTSRGVCADYAGETTSSGGCVSHSNIRTANWFYPWKRFAIKREAEPSARHGVSYELPDGKRREVEVPLQQVERTLILVERNDYEGLAQLPDVSCELLFRSNSEYVLTYI